MHFYQISRILFGKTTYHASLFFHHRSKRNKQKQHGLCNHPYCFSIILGVTCLSCVYQYHGLLDVWHHFRVCHKALYLGKDQV